MSFGQLLLFKHSVNNAVQLLLHTNVSSYCSVKVLTRGVDFFQLKWVQMQSRLDRQLNNAILTLAQLPCRESLFF